jgi:tungstate transport system ATP-binding protein
MSFNGARSDLPIELAAVEVEIAGAKLLRAVSLMLDSGAPTMLIGPNGSGKTTLLRVAMGLLAPSSGAVSWGGVKDSPPTRRAIVLQRPVMLRRSAADNVRYALWAAGVPRAARAARVSELLSRVGLEALGERPARRLSSGEQQRLALARALARDPEVLFLDEPTASLDPAATNAIEELVRAVSANGVKVIMATHDLGEARRLAGEIVLLHRGVIIERASVERFFTAPATFEAKRFIAGELLL